MDKLERYLDQVCRSIAGPRSLRQHVRQELREHLLDAVAQHKAAGLAEDTAIDKAIEEFGKVEEVRSELEAAHGQRTTWILDKALQWKEKTMKAKWLWMTVAHVSLVLVIALEVAWIWFANVFLVPRFKKLLADGYINHSILDIPEPAWGVAFLDGQHDFFGHYTTWLLLLCLAAVSLFEWRVKSENKPWMRLSALGMAAMGLMVLAVLVAASLVVPHMMGVPAMGKMARPWTVQQVAVVDTHLHGMELAMKRPQGWDEMRAEAHAASSAMTLLANGPALTSLAGGNGQQTLGELRSHLNAAQDSLRAAQEALEAKDLGRAQAELAQTRKAFAPLSEAAKRPAP